MYILMISNTFLSLFLNDRLKPEVGVRFEFVCGGFESFFLCIF